MDAQQENVINLYKNKGETPLGALERLRRARPELANVPLSYAGRLDPAAEGVLVVLVGEENKNRQDHLNLGKEYEIEVIFGISTDSYDLLGLVTEIRQKTLSKKDIHDAVLRLKGRQLQKYPPFSSRPVEGKPMFEHAREDNLASIVVPVREVYVYAIELLKTATIASRDLLAAAQTLARNVVGDFRQEEIVSTWQKVLTNKKYMFQTAKISVSASSGTYMRSLAVKLGESLGLPALAPSIVRTKVGEYELKDSLRLD